jgi:hypothetical protein
MIYIIHERGTKEEMLKPSQMRLRRYHLESPGQRKIRIIAGEKARQRVRKILP